MGSVYRTRDHQNVNKKIKFEISKGLKSINKWNKVVADVCGKKQNKAKKTLSHHKVNFNWRHTSQPSFPLPVAAHCLWVSAAAPKTTDWAIMADALSTLSCCVQTNKSGGGPVEHLRDVEALVLLCLPQQALRMRQGAAAMLACVCSGRLWWRAR